MTEVAQNAVAEAIHTAATNAAADAHDVIVAASRKAVLAVTSAQNSVITVSHWEATAESELEAVKAEVEAFFRSLIELPEHLVLAVVHAVKLPFVAIVALFKKA